MEKRKNNCSSYGRMNDATILEILRENEVSCKFDSERAQEGRSCSHRVDTNPKRYNTVAERRSESCNMRYNKDRYDKFSVNEFNHGDENCSCRDEALRIRNRRCYDGESMPHSCNYNDQIYTARQEESNSNNSCRCNEKCVSESCINNYSPAMVYCPDHEFSDMYESDEALEHGTLFKVLDLVFYPSRCGNCR